MASLKERRKSLGWSRAELAQRAALDRNVVALIERELWSEEDALTRVAYVLSQAESGNLDVQLEPPPLPDEN